MATCAIQACASCGHADTVRPLPLAVPKPWAPAKRQKALAICDRYGVDLRTVALQFAAAPQVVSAVIPGARTAEQARANASSMRVAIPSAVWEALKREGVIEADAPVPAAR